MSAKVRTWTWTWRSSTSACRVVYDGRQLNAAAVAMMRRHTWKEYGVNIWVQRTWRNRGVATGIPWRRWTWRPWESVGEADGNLGRPRRPAFMVSKAADAAVWEDLKDIKPPMYDGNPLSLDRFLEKLDDWGVTVTEDMHPADAEKYVFGRFRYRLPEVLQELHFVATKEGRIKTLKEAKKWLNEQERVDAPQVAAKRWKSIKLQHDGREIRLRDWGDFRGHYTLLRRNVEDWNEGDEQARLLSMLRGGMDQEGHRGGIQAGQVQPHGQDVAPQRVSYERGGLDEKERGPGYQTALPAERSPHHRLGRSREDRDVAP